MNPFTLLFLFIFFIFFHNQPEKITTATIDRLPAMASPQQEKEVLKIKVFNNDTLQTTVKAGGFGYDILRNDILYIHQPNIPAVAGNAGFRSAHNAQKSAKLVVYKIQHHILPPTVSIHELDSLGVLK